LRTAEKDASRTVPVGSKSWDIVVQQCNSKQQASGDNKKMPYGGVKE
jgi:hypothetical protein